MSGDFDINNGIQRSSGSEDLQDLMRMNLQAEQMEFFQRQNQAANQGNPGGDTSFSRGEIKLWIGVIALGGLVALYHLIFG